MPDDFNCFRNKILSKNYSNLNICPGFLIKYTWKKDTAINLDKQGEFEKDFQEKVNRIFDVFNKESEVN